VQYFGGKLSKRQNSGKDGRVTWSRMLLACLTMCPDGRPC